MKHTRPLIKFLIGWPLTLISLFFIFKIISPHFFEVSSQLNHINIGILLLGITSFITYFFIRSIFWKKLLALKGHSLTLKEISYYWGFTEIKRYIPGNIWSLLSRANMLSGRKVPIKTTVTATIIEAEFITIGSLLLSIFSLNFIFYGLLPNFPHKSLSIFIITTGIIITALLFMANQRLGNIIRNLPAIPAQLLPHFSFQDNFYLLLTKTAAMFFFGLGTYLVISSLQLLYLPYILTLIGFFVFSLLVGYLSLITPMGLGVREGIITVGLAKFIPLSLAGFGAIFSRIIFIVSELLFLLITYTWHKSKNSKLLRLEGFIQKYKYEVFLGIAILLYILYFTAASFLRYDNFFTGRFDLGNMDQTVWNTLHGRIFQATDPNGTNIISRLAFHADFILILLAPFYFFWQDPKNLLLIQTIVVAGGAIFVYLIAEVVLSHSYKEINKPKLTAFLFAILYLLNPAVQYTNLFDFHGVTLATTFLLGAFYFLKSKHYNWFLIFIFLSGITKEEVWIITALLGLYTVFAEKKKQLGSMIFLASIAIFSVLLFYAIPHAKGGSHFALSYYSDFGSSPKEIIGNLLLKPQKTVPLFFQKDQLTYVFELLLPFGFLSLLSPLSLLFILPEITADLLSTNANPHSIYYQYTATLTPFFFISAIYGLRGITKHFKKIPIILYTLYLILNTLVAAYFYGPLPGAKSPDLDMFTRPQPYRNIINNFLNGIPKKFSVATTNNLGSHLSRRQKIFTIPVGIDKADIILFLLDDPFAQPSLAAQKKMVENMKHDQKYIEIFKVDDFIVFEKRDLYLHNEPVTNRIKLFPVSIPALQNRDFVGGGITIEKQLDNTDQFSSYLISYPSDGLKINALLDIPNDPLPTKGFPVVIVNHDFGDRQKYNTEISDKKITDYFASRGFAVIKPDFRGNAGSEDDTTLPRILAYPVDTLNLISSLPSLRQVNPQNVFLWGQSVGATVTLTAIIAHDQNNNFVYPLKGATVWSPLTDPYRGYVQFKSLSTNQRVPYTKTLQLLGTPQKNPLLWQSFSPLYYIDDIKTPIQINQGIADTVTPYQWSIELYDDLLSSNKNASLQLYPNEDHSFSHTDDSALRDNVVFFRKLLKNSL